MGIVLNEDMFKKTLGRFLRLKRIEKGITLEELGHIAQVDDKHLGKIERGNKIPRSDTLFQLLIALNATNVRIYDILAEYKSIKNEDDR
ncbi:helix-turn-helix domain-containing protein [Alteribacillus sp. JSM 102045]|uniref:helix-turn-helix domain-containing protein n=1 Tax=Alteribacillus sp. JSM 102045 TaxID=1562101 RepID=UPI0035C0A808